MHLKESHSIEINEEQVIFKDYQEFLNFKEKEEKNTYSYFSKINIKNDLENSQCKYERFICQFHGSSRKHS